MRDVAWLLAVAGAFLLGFLLGSRMAAAHSGEPEPTSEPVFRRFEVPEPSPKPIVGLHDYALPVDRPTPTVEPTPKASRSPRERDRGQARRFIARSRDDRYAGRASWHATGRDGFYAAACAPLRHAMGRGWRGQRVLVAFRKRAVEVVLNDWCASKDKAIDLSDEVFSYFRPLSRGVIDVVIQW
jgi:hypothetical protein